MKPIVLPLRAAALLFCFSFLALSPADAGVKAVNDCVSVGRKVKSAVEKDPTKVLVILEDALTAHPDCACEIVKGAVIGSDADNALVKQIVITAVSTVEDRAAEIAECAVAAAPDSAKFVKQGLEEALGDVVAASGKSAPFVGAPVTINGIYLIPPVTAGSRIVTRENTQIVIVPVPTSPSNPTP